MNGQHSAVRTKATLAQLIEDDAYRQIVLKRFDDRVKRGDNADELELFFQSEMGGYYRWIILTGVNPLSS